MSLSADARDGDFQLQTASAAGRYLDVLTGAKRAKEERILDSSTLG